MKDFRTSTRARKQSWFGVKKWVKSFAARPLPHAALRFASRWIPVLRRGRLPAPRNLPEVVGRLDGVGFVMLRPDRCENAKELYWGRGSRTVPADANALHVVSELAVDADVFLDVGAYTGLFTIALTAVNPNLEAHAFEIVPAVADLLEANVRRNRVEDRVWIHREGVGVPGTTMTVPFGDGGSALPSFYSARMRFSDGVSVPFRSLDSLHEIVPTDARVLMKIDVEGSESDVIAHGVDFITRHAPDILCEVLPGGDPTTLVRILAPIGYEFLLVREHDLARHERIVPNDRFRDWLFTTRVDALNGPVVPA